MNSTLAPTNAAPPVLEGRNLWKRFGASVSLADVTIQLHAGKVLALLGDNGAGKSTLVKILCGVLAPDDGALLLEGTPVRFGGPAQARESGISTVFQDLAICPLLSVKRNLILGNEPTRGRFFWRRIDRKRAGDEATAALSELGVKLKRGLEEPASTLSGGERQAVAIARAMHYGSKCLILDEPTSALAVRQADKVLEHIESAAVAGQAVLLVTHNFRHAVSIADEILVLSHGSVVGVYHKGEIEIEELIDLVSQNKAAHPDRGSGNN